ncbi:phage portal protein [Pseudomonas putida]|uniref:phage portal protein n=1 Tax=Pseudomonas putida TaxID=303 RepID=UPI0008193075|nr:phage portal protein [Pseudomonas putida]OCT30203.1 phage portal protein [Pseudomonas putida]OCT31713.1 phage portal protein [Pseudomonas putida]OCT32695.1 phage portal protein [Pseudomonas putida]OCT41019.1 phage portal protein [Pseudomonas putida]
MKLFNWGARTEQKALRPADNRGGWLGVIRESFAGAWQQNVEVDQDTVLAFSAVFSCITLIASDIAKLRVKLVEFTKDKVWEETTSPSFSPVLRKPNHFQNRIQFYESWMTSKLTSGNAYALKLRDARGVVTKLYILDPRRVTPLVGDDGSIFYDLKADNLSTLEEGVVVPASEIIHDRMNCLFHPLVGVSPIYACGLAAMQGNAIQNNSAKFFQNGSKPGGVLTAPGAISEDTAKRLKAHWDSEYTGQSAGKVAVLGDGLKYEGMAMSAADSQLIEQLKWSAEIVCSVFHVPGYKVGVGAQPTYNSAEVLNQVYYSDCLQTLIEALELCLDEGLELPSQYGTEFDLDGLLRMDTAALYKANNEAVSGAWMKPNEARRRAGLPPVEGGDSPMIQQQNYSLAAIARRDAQADPLSTAPAAPALTEPAQPSEPSNEELDDQARMFALLVEKELNLESS